LAGQIAEKKTKDTEGTVAPLERLPTEEKRDKKHDDRVAQSRWSPHLSLQISCKEKNLALRNTHGKSLLEVNF
jgi:hypothetical protein